MHESSSFLSGRLCDATQYERWIKAFLKGVGNFFMHYTEIEVAFRLVVSYPQLQVLRYSGIWTAPEVHFKRFRIDLEELSTVLCHRFNWWPVYRCKCSRVIDLITLSRLSIGTLACNSHYLSLSLRILIFQSSLDVTKGCTVLLDRDKIQFFHQYGFRTLILYPKYLSQNFSLQQTYWY